MQKTIRLFIIGKLELKKTALYYSYQLVYIILNLIVLGDRPNLLYCSFF